MYTSEINKNALRSIELNDAIFERELGSSASLSSDGAIFDFRSCSVVDGWLFTLAVSERDLRVRIQKLSEKIAPAFLLAVEQCGNELDLWVSKIVQFVPFTPVEALLFEPICAYILLNISVRYGIGPETKLLYFSFKLQHVNQGWNQRQETWYLYIRITSAVNSILIEWFGSEARCGPALVLLSPMIQLKR